MQNVPKVIIGLPVFNGAGRVGKMLDSLVKQTYRNFVICVIDNDSSDGTKEVVAEFVKSDERVRYFRNDHNIGAVGNFNRAFEIAKQIRPDYFMWAADDDYYDPDFLTRAIAEFQKRPDVVLVSTITSCIADKREIFKDYNATILDENPSVRFYKYRRLLDQDGYVGSLFYGLMRFSVVTSIGSIRQAIASDHITVLELVLHGKFVTIDKVLFFKAAGGGSASLDGAKRVLEITNFFHFHFPYLNREVMINEIVWNSAALSLPEKMKCTAYSFYCYLRFIKLRNGIRQFKTFLKLKVLRMG